MEKNRIIYLLEAYRSQSISEEELTELRDYIENTNNKDLIINSMVDEMMMAEGGEVDEHIWRLKVAEIVDADKVVVVRVGKSKIYTMWKTVAAAVVVGLVIWSLLFVLRQAQDDDSLRQAQTDPSINSGQDIKAPSTNRAMITLADGKVVYLDSAGNGSLAIQQGVEVMKDGDGVIKYILRQAQGDNQVYNTLTNPRGSKVIDITLSDGSRVWLNAGSSLRYPVVFGGDKREVEIRGEGYFEVSKVSSEQSVVSGKPQGGGRTTGGNIPFLVESGGVVTEVLGTKFNVNAYEDEGSVNVTLLEGSVVVKRENVKRENVKREGVKLVPGQAARLMSNDPSAELRVTNNVDIEEVMAWKNGRFAFNKADIKTVMREIGRWYDLEVVYEGKSTNDLFGGDIQRDLPLSKTLDFLRKSGVDFGVEGRKVVVRGGRE